MNKQQFIDEVATKTSQTKAVVERVIDAMTETIEEELVKGENFTLHGFGTFKLSHRKARTGRNPRTQEAIEIPASTSVGFKGAKKLTDAVNNA